MQVQELHVDLIDVSVFNTRKDLADGQQDSSIEDLARSIEKQGLLSPITVYQTPDGRFALVAGQRRLMAHKHLGRETIPAIVHEEMSDEDATAVSLVENVHRADMNPRDKAMAFKALVDQLGSVQAVSKATGVGDGTIRKYVHLVTLAPALQAQLAAGEVRNTEALASLAKKFGDHAKQEEVWEQISGFRQDVQSEVIRRLDINLSNLSDLFAQAASGALGVQVIRNCPFDCPTIPDALKQQVATLVANYKTMN
jgi:ParB family chromosome partitioning protein